MRYLNPAELSRLFRVMYSQNKTHQLAALTAFWTGARVSQVLRLRGEDIFEANGKMVVKIHAAKRGLERLHTLHIDPDPAFDMSPLIDLAKKRPFARLFGGTTRQYLNQCLKRYCTMAGLNPDFGHSHVFRHSISMLIWDGTHRLGTITHFLGHASPQSAVQYLSENSGLEAQAVVDGIQLA